MRTEQLRRFVVLAEELNFTRAAARLHVAQQVLSAQLKQLEAAVGVELLARTTRRVELTPAGAAFLDRARVAIAEVDGAVRAAQEAAGRLQLLLACEIDAQWLLADRLAPFRAAHPSAEVVVVYVLDLSALTELGASRVDGVAVWGLPPAELADDHLTVAVEEVHAILPESDPLAKGDTVTAGALADRTLWLWPPATGRRMWDLLAGAVGATDEGIGIAGSPGGGAAQELMIKAVQEQGGYTFAPASYLQRAHPARTVAVPLDPPLRIPLTLCWRGRPSPGLQRLLQHLEGGVL